MQLGHGEIIAIRLPVLFEVFERLVQNGITIYDAEVPAEPPPCRRTGSMPEPSAGERVRELIGFALEKLPSMRWTTAPSVTRWPRRGSLRRAARSATR